MGSFKQFIEEQEAIHVKKGAFHAWLGKSPDEKITAADIAKGKAAGGHAAKMATFAQNFAEDSEGWTPKKENKGYDPYNSNQGGAAPKKKKNVRQIAMKMAQKKGVDPRNSHDAQAKAYKTAYSLHGPKNEEVEAIDEKVTRSAEQLQDALKKAERKAAGVQRSKADASYIEALKAALRRIKGKAKLSAKDVGIKTEEVITELSKKTLGSYKVKALSQIKKGKGALTDKDEKRFNGVSKAVRKLKD